METCALSACTRTRLNFGCTAAQHEQKPLWREGSEEANNPAIMYGFPVPEDIIGGIILPPEYEGKLLTKLSLSVFTPQRSPVCLFLPPPPGGLAFRTDSWRKRSWRTSSETIVCGCK